VECHGATSTAFLSRDKYEITEQLLRLLRSPFQIQFLFAHRTVVQIQVDETRVRHAKVSREHFKVRDRRLIHPTEW
jgi:hypothetical protein